MRVLLVSSLLVGSLALISGQACNTAKRTPRAYKKLIDLFDSPPVSASLPPVACDVESSLRKTVDWVAEGDVGVCGNTYEFSTGIESCCGGRSDDNSRTINMNLDFSSAEREIAQAMFHIETTSPAMRCCNRCKCWGDPHCSAFDNSEAEAREKIKSFLVCDTASILGPGRCTNRLEASTGAQERCLGLSPGYGLNTGKCEWIADNADYNVALDGGPCVPVESYKPSVVMFDRNYSGNARARNGRWEHSRVVVAANVGERGISKSIEIRMHQRNVNNGATKVDKLILDVKKTCGYLRNDETTYITPSEQDAEHSVVETPYFNVVRRVAIQSTGDGRPVAVDMMWFFQDKLHGDSLQFNCKGGTDASISVADGLVSYRSILEDEQPTGAADIGATYQYIPNSAALPESDPLFSGLASVSSRPSKATIIDSKFYVSTINPGADAGAGFCFTSEFAEYRLPELYNGETSPLEAACQLFNNFDYSDRTALSQLASCKKILKANSCYDFVKNDRADIAFSKNTREIKWLRTFSQNLETCAKVYCASEAYIPPTGSVLECYTDFLDLGAAVTMAEYFPKPVPATNNMFAGGADSSAPVLQMSCEPKYTVHYYTAQGAQVSKEWIPGSGPVVFDVQGTPVRAELEINDCAGVCAVRPDVAITSAEFVTECSPASSDSVACFNPTTHEGACGECLGGCQDACTPDDVVEP